jgi:hypothetical protein
MLEYHKTAVVRSDKFRARFLTGATIAEDIDKASAAQVLENRGRLIPIVKTILFCGRQNIALRSHRDDGNLMDVKDDNDTADISIVKKDGNFRALLKFRIDSGDDLLRNHLETAGSNATYISKMTQNELIKAAGGVIRNKILSRVAAARFFAILADETTDASRSEMMTFCVRYTDENKNVREDFMDFLVVDDVTSEGLAKTILQYMKTQNMNTQYLVGQGYDGASTMSGKFNGVQAIIRRQHSTALHVHCARHCLNLTLCRSCEQQAVRNVMGVIQETAKFVNASPRRVAMMENCLETVVPSTNRHRVRQLCVTRWVERHDAVISFITLYPAIQRCLEQCADELNDVQAATKARMLLISIQQPEFLVAACVLSDVLNVTHCLAQQLQSVQIDLLSAMKLVGDVIALLERKRQTADSRLQTFGRRQVNWQTCPTLN